MTSELPTLAVLSTLFCVDKTASVGSFDGTFSNCHIRLVFPSELVELQMLKNVHWVPTGEQLADCMTKLSKNANWLLKVASSNRMDQ